MDASLEFLEERYRAWSYDPTSVPDDLRAFFARLGPPIAHAAPSFRPPRLFGGGSLADAAQRAALLQERLDALVRAYRERGHLVAAIDPLDVPRPPQLELDPAFHGLGQEDLQRRISSRTLHRGGIDTAADVIGHLQRTYTCAIGVQFMHIEDLWVREWLQRRMESTENSLELTRAQQVRILEKLTDAAVFEEFLQKKFLGAKTFSLEGAESLIPLLDLAIERAARLGVDTIVMGMAHRGRLNVLANILGKDPAQIFEELEDPDRERSWTGDVKHHLGFSSNVVTESGRQVHLSLAFNPSHLEYVTPVVAGRLRAKQDRAPDRPRTQSLAIVIHGDAAIAAEGVVQETLQLSGLPGYTVGGTIHVVINNQIGFTTPPEEARTSLYATDVAKLLPSPIFHVNGEEPEAVAQVIELALEFRQSFQRDVVIDMYCYRRRGHNETDEPAFTQPLLYDHIRRRRPVRQVYLEHLLALGGITHAEADAIGARRTEKLQQELSRVRRGELAAPGLMLWGVWEGYRGGLEPADDDADTGVPEERLRWLLERLTEIPHDFHVHGKLRRGLEQRRRMASGELPIDWSTGEALALGTVAAEGVRVRLTGQDTARGTFSQRHAVLHDVRDGRTYVPLQNLEPGQGRVEVYNSPLSEAGALAFEYGVSLDAPEALVLWEAQFGDFVNAAQVIVDQFITSAEEKWQRLSGIVLLLPHGFEGQGPEHSSARPERFLGLAARHNIQVVNATTPAQYFHALRRQALRRWKKPLIMMTPKSLLRLPAASSELGELARGRFHKILGDPEHEAGAERVLLTSGRVYYDLAAARERLGRHEVAIVRLEQLYPLSEDELGAALAPYSADTPLLWVQEEPENMGAWRHLWVELGPRPAGHRLGVVARPASASPATGWKSTHEREQRRLVERAFRALPGAGTGPEVRPQAP